MILFHWVKKYMNSSITFKNQLPVNCTSKRSYLKWTQTTIIYICTWLLERMQFCTWLLERMQFFTSPTCNLPQYNHHGCLGIKKKKKGGGGGAERVPVWKANNLILVLTKNWDFLKKHLLLCFHSTASTCIFFFFLSYNFTIMMQLKIAKLAKMLAFLSWNKNHPKVHPVLGGKVAIFPTPVHKCAALPSLAGMHGISVKQKTLCSEEHSNNLLK